jgi:multisubunit Na+/H+ antiporter MnhF subunit
MGALFFPEVRVVAVDALRVEACSTIVCLSLMLGRVYMRTTANELLLVSV